MADSDRRDSRRVRLLAKSLKRYESFSISLPSERTTKNTCSMIAIIYSLFTRFKGGFFQYPVLVTLLSPLRPDQSSTRHSYCTLMEWLYLYYGVVFLDNFSAIGCQKCKLKEYFCRVRANYGQFRLIFNLLRLKFEMK